MFQPAALVIVDGRHPFSNETDQHGKSGAIRTMMNRCPSSNFAMTATIRPIKRCLQVEGENPERRDGWPRNPICSPGLG